MTDPAHEGWLTMTATRPTTITADELVSNPTAILDRVRRQHERFEVTDGDAVIATIEPGRQSRGITISELIEKVGNLQMPGDGFADDLEAAQASQRPPKAPEWPD